MKARFLLFSVVMTLTVLGTAVFSDDWPMYRHDAFRTAISSDTITFPLHLKWAYQARRPPQPAWPNPARENLGGQAYLHPLNSYDWAYPVVASQGKVVYSSSSEDKIVCLDALTGEEVWSFLCEGPVRFPPALSGAQVLFGADDGWVYCVRLADGKLVWKSNFNPDVNWLPGNNRLISALPVRTEVMAFNNQVFFGFGVFPNMAGAKLVTLSQSDGTLLRNAVVDFSPEGYLIRSGDTAAYYEPPEGEEPFRRNYNDGLAIPPDQEYMKLDSAILYSGATRLVGRNGQIAASNPSWSAAVTGRVFSMAYAEGRLIASTDSGWIYCFDTALTTDPQTIEPPYFDFPAHAASYAQAVQDMLDSTGTIKGYALVLDNNEGFLAYELAQATELQVACVDNDSARASLFRRRIDSAGLGGRVTVHVLKNSTLLPFPNHLFNLVTCDAFGTGAAYQGTLRNEAIRVLRPYGGTAFLKNNAAQAEEKGPIQGAGEWTHYFGTSGNDLNSNDSFAGQSFHLQWFGRPGPEHLVDRHLKPQAPLWKNGIMVIPGQNWATGVDAYNGTILWDQAIPLSSRLPGNRGIGYMVLQDDYLYSASGGQCLGFDAPTGELRLTYSLPDLGTGLTYHWGWVACSGELLLGSAIATDAYRVGGAGSRALVDYPDEVTSYLTEVSDGLFAFNRFDPDEGEKWKYRSLTGAIVNRTIVVTEGKVIFLASTNPWTLSAQAHSCRIRLDSLFGNHDARLVALDITTGTKVWEKSVDMSQAYITVGMIARSGRVITAGASDSFTTCWYGACRLPRHDYFAFSAATGDTLWKYHWARGGEGSINDHVIPDVYPVCVGDTLYLPGYYGTRLGLDVRTGKSTGWTGGDHYPGCGIASASRSHLYFRNGNPVACEPLSERQTRLTTVTRPGCWINMVPAGGLMNISEGQAGCICNYPIQTSMALLSDQTPPGLYTAIDRKSPKSTTFGLDGYPNPFNPSVNLTLTLPFDAGLNKTPFVLEIFNVQGQVIQTFRKQVKSGAPCHVIWQGMDSQGRKAASGVYYFRLTYGSRSLVRSFVLLK